MSNTMLAEKRLKATDYVSLAEPERIPVSPARHSNRRKPNKSAASSVQDWFTVGVLLVCMTAVCIAGIIYVSAFARVYRQAQNIEQLNGEIASAAAQNEALVKNLAQLQSDHRIGPLAAKFQMTQDGASTFIDVIPAQSTGQREVASAL